MPRIKGIRKPSKSKTKYKVLKKSFKRFIWEIQLFQLKQQLKRTKEILERSYTEIQQLCEENLLLKLKLVDFERETSERES